MKRVTPSELLDLREPPWGRKLRGVSLVAEVEIPGDYCRQAAQALGMLYRKWVNAHRDPAPLFDSWPACTAVAMAWVAAEHYEQGTYWPFLWREVGYPATTDDHPAWGLGFQRAVGSLGMPTFPEMPMPYLGPVLMHSGIPTYCLEDFFRLLLQRQRAEPGLDAESFMSWATAPGRELRLHELDMPARRFLQYGGDFALDVVERCIDLLHRLLDPDPDLDGVGLPARIVARARELAAQERLELIPATSARNGLRREQPRITLDPFGRGVEVRLPAVSEAPDGVATWKIAADHVQTVVRSQALWVGAAEGTPPTTYALPGPVRSVMVSLADSALESELTVVDPADPLLVFTEDGRRVPANLPLPTEPIWALHPENQELTVDGPLDVRAEGALPLGWNGWQLRLLSLEGVRALGLTRRRPVRGFTRPRILVGEPLPGVTTPYGSPVFAEPPTLWLPGESAALTAWFVEVRPSSGGDAVVTRRFDTTEPTTVEDLWKELPRPLLGAYDIVVRGPLGRGARRSVVIAEGLHVAYRPYVRLFTGAGLTAGQAELTSGSPASSRQLEFTPRMRALSVTHVVQGASEPLVITPPHLQVLREVPGEAATWSMGPLRLSTESFTEPGALLVRLPGATALPPIQVSTGNGIMQVLEPSGRQHDGTARYELARISDTIAEQKVADLLLGETPLAFVRPRRLATGVRDLGDRLGLEDATPVEGLVAGIYLVTAPWREPWVLPVEDGLIGLPPELLDSGPMRVLLQIEDPWTFTEWPRWPVGAGGFLCDRPGFYQAGDVEETALASFLIGDAPFPTDVTQPARLWPILDLADALQDSGAVPYIAGKCAQRLRAEPASAIEALLTAGLPHENLISALIGTGLASAAVRTSDIRDLRRLWSVLPGAAAMLSDPSDTRWRDAASAECGESLEAILAEGHDPHAMIGRFGPEADRLAYMPASQLDLVWAAADIVPRALLDADTRLTAARRLFDARVSVRAKSVARNATHILSTARRLLDQAGYGALLSQLADRSHPQNKGGWYALPAVSTALALIARTAARGDDSLASCAEAFRDDWVKLAAVAPELVTIDLVLAELLVVSSEHEWPKALT